MRLAGWYSSLSIFSRLAIGMGLVTAPGVIAISVALIDGQASLATVAAVSDEALPMLVYAQTAAVHAEGVAAATSDLASGDAKAKDRLDRHILALRGIGVQLKAAFADAGVATDTDFKGLEDDGMALATIVRRRDSLTQELGRRLTVLDAAQQAFRRRIQPVLVDAEQQVALQAEALVAEATEAARHITGDDYALVRETYAMLADANLAWGSLAGLTGSVALEEVETSALQFDRSVKRLRSSARKLDRLIAGQNIKALVADLGAFGSRNERDAFTWRRDRLTVARADGDTAALRSMINAATTAHGELVAKLGRLAGLGRARMLERTSALIDLAKDSTNRLLSVMVERQRLALELRSAADLLVALVKEATSRDGERLDHIEVEVETVMANLAARREAIQRLEASGLVDALLSTAQPETVIALRRQALDLSREAAALVDAALGRSKHFALSVRKLTEMRTGRAAEQAQALAHQIKQSFVLLLLLTLAFLMLAPLALWLFVHRDVIRDIKRMTEIMRRLAGGELDLDIVGVARRDELGDMAKALVVFRSNARDLKSALDSERQLNGLQRQFVSMVSHEFRTPLAIIDGNAQRLLRRPEAAESVVLQKAMSKVRLSVRRLTELMESVLSAARLEEGRIKFEPGDCDLASLVTEVSNNHAELNTGHQLIVDADQDSAHIFADEKLLRQVISNLISNAIKYSPTGSRVWVESRAGPDGEIRVSVRDEGVGIPKDEQAKLFERFFRASTSVGIAGSGIGLHLAQHLAALHQGSIEFESVEGQGTTFTLRLPGVPQAADDGGRDRQRARQDPAGSISPDVHAPAA